MSVTDKVIRETFIQMLNEEKLSDITVRKIAERCGISRNAFYYHYANIPELLDTIIRDGVDRIIASVPEGAGLEESLTTLYKQALSRKKLLMHVHFSGSRYASDEYLRKLCDYIARRFLNTKVFNIPQLALSDHDKELITSYLFYELVGQCTVWFNERMPESFVDEIREMSSLIDTNVRRIVFGFNNRQPDKS
ncbi:MAG: TetR/AcrR family transcriptional regulator [Anaerovoracaceae bacterium]|jgi:AcrR family transcriptional regulator